MKDQVQDSSQIDLPSHLRVRQGIQANVRSSISQESSLPGDSSLARAFESKHGHLQLRGSSRSSMEEPSEEEGEGFIPPAAHVSDPKGIANERRIYVHYPWSGVTILNLLFFISPFFTFGYYRLAMLGPTLDLFENNTSKVAFIQSKLLCPSTNDSLWKARNAGNKKKEKKDKKGLVTGTNGEEGYLLLVDVEPTSSVEQRNESKSRELVVVGPKGRTFLLTYYIPASLHGSFFSSPSHPGHMDYSQVVRHRFLVPACKGSNPFTLDSQQIKQAKEKKKKEKLSSLRFIAKEQAKGFRKIVEIGKVFCASFASMSVDCAVSYLLKSSFPAGETDADSTSVNYLFLFDFFTLFSINDCHVKALSQEVKPARNTALAQMLFISKKGIPLNKRERVECSDRTRDRSEPTVVENRQKGIGQQSQQRVHAVNEGTLREEIKSACEYRPFEKCDYIARISNEICCKKVEYVFEKLDGMKETIDEYHQAV
ncbi:mediator of RNA polymerase II transcription subunit 11 [Tanacetum coccineum]